MPRLFALVPVVARALSVLTVAVLTTACLEAADATDWNTKSTGELLPATANAIAIVRVEQLLQSRRAIEQQYADKADENYRAGGSTIPPWVKNLAVGFLLRPSEAGPAYRAMIAEVAADAPIEAIGGQAQQMFGHVPLLSTKRDAVFVGKPGGRVVGWSPASRRELGHWLKGDFAHGLSPVLADLASLSSDIVMAIDLTDLVDAGSAEQRFQSDAHFDGNIDRAVELATASKSVCLTVDISADIAGLVAITFGSSLELEESDADLAKSIFLSVVNDTGYGVHEFETMTARIDGDQVLLEGVLEDDSLQALTSLAVPPLPATKSGSSRTVSSGGRESRNMSSPIDDFTKATNMIDSLNRRQKRAKSPSSVAGWCDRTAAQLDDVSIATSDQNVASFTSRSATRLRAIGQSLRGMTTDMNAEQATLTYNVKRTAGWASVNVWGGVGYRDPTVNVESNLREVRTRQAAVVQQSAAEREAVWAMIQEDQAATRRALVGGGQQ